MVRNRTQMCPKANRKGKRIGKEKLDIEELELGVKSPTRRFKLPRLWVPYSWVSLRDYETTFYLTTHCAVFSFM